MIISPWFHRVLEEIQPLFISVVSNPHKDCLKILGYYFICFNLSFNSQNFHQFL